MLMWLQRSQGIRLFTCVSLAVLFTQGGVHAQSLEEFYRGKTLNMIIGYPTGGSNDIYARAVARYIGKHIPGNPTVIPRNMPGGGSLVAANHVFNVAPKDGTILALISPTIPLEERLGVPNVMLKSAEFNWIGRVAAGVNMTFVMSNVPVKTIQDTFKREVILGASARSSTVAIYPAVVSNVIGAKFKLVMGYQSSTAAMLAMERGEVEGHSTSLEVVRAVHPDWLAEKKVTVLVQYALKRHPELKDIPMSWELGRNDEEKQILRIVANATEVGKMILSTPTRPRTGSRRCGARSMRRYSILRSSPSSRRSASSSARCRARSCRSSWSRSGPCRLRSSRRSRRSIR
jgi:tripartite-type tricarboxylate transporter receptor subunit TctC